MSDADPLLLLLLAADWSRLEDEWVEAVAESPADVVRFGRVARATAEAGKEKLAAELLDILDDQLKEKRLWPQRLALLRDVGRIVATGEALHRRIFETLRHLHAGRPSFEPFAEKVGLHRGLEETSKTWEKVDRLDMLLGFDVGAVVEMEGKGVGRVVDVNLALESLRIDLERQKGLVVGFRAASRLLRPLPVDHFLRRKLEAPDELRALGEADPPQLLRALLQSAGKPLTAGEIKETLASLVDEKRWTSWWASARKHPQVVASGGGRQSYHWAASSDHALDSVRAAFAAAKDSAKIEFFRRHGDRDPEFARAMAADLAAIATESRAAEPALAFEIWFALERADLLPADIGWSVDDLLAPTIDPRRLVSTLEDRLLRERALVMVRERRDDWVGVYRDAATRESDSRVLNLLFEGLRSGAPAERDKLIEEVQSMPRRAPGAFVWLAERAIDDVSLRERNPLRLLQQILSALQDDTFSAFRTRLLALVDSGGTVPRLMSHLTEEQAAQAASLLERAPGLEDYQRSPLTNALHLRFPALRESGSDVLYTTPESLEGKREELRRLVQSEIPANRKAIEEARAMGDLRENFEYKSARERHEYLNARVAGLHRDLARARPIDAKTIDTGEVRIGTRISLEGPAGASRQLTILGPWESRPEDGVISYESELAKGILGRRIGEEVQVGETLYKIAAIAAFR